MPAKNAYHHGNLHRALMDEALAVIGEKGVAALSLREIASGLGVSHAAPYHHFSDKAELLNALAEEGWGLLDQQMSLADKAAGDDPGRRLLGLGMAYVTFAVEHPAYYAAFTAPERVGTADVEPPTNPSGGIWGRLMSAVAACQSDGLLPEGDPTIFGVYLWSLVHGMAGLWRSGALAQMPQARGGLEPLARQVLTAGLSSLALQAR